jgi:hypothetical protein
MEQTLQRNKSSSAKKLSTRDVLRENIFSTCLPKLKSNIFLNVQAVPRGSRGLTVQLAEGNG